MPLEHKDIVFPEVDLSDDDGDPEWNGSDTEEILPPDPMAGHYRLLRPPGLHTQVWGYIKEDWEEAAARYESDPGSFYSSWYYLNDHPAFWQFQYWPSSLRPPNHVSHLLHDYAFGSDAITMMVMLVNENGIATSEEDSTHTEIWLEAGKRDLFTTDGHSTPWHDIELDCGAPTYEEAVIKLARLVWEHYGNDRRVADAPPPQPQERA